MRTNNGRLRGTQLEMKKLKNMAKGSGYLQLNEKLMVLKILPSLIPIKAMYPGTTNPVKFIKKSGAISIKQNNNDIIRNPKAIYAGLA
jgi:hypothetical protein